ncbi:MAG: type III-B CRISPR-associated protein Cas10/Cmr2 [Acidobacteriia bacterium]|nr:type III-B CRISPR-associated protein Cas10/Cmr2 [Terriglobia bacterium]
MTGHLLAINIGPVQDFIAAARRTRDLWFGSHMLSEVSKAAALAIQEIAGMDALIFPAPDNETDLQPTPDGADSKLLVANVILALIPQGIDPCEAAAQAKCAAGARWREFAEDARRQVADLVRGDIWNDQLDDVIEFYSAWVPFPLGGDYARARARVMRLLSARKSCRDFQQPRLSAEMRRVPKSSLDGARETVLKKGVEGSARLRLSKGEQLDAIGLAKRLAAGVQSYPSVARIAADPWLRRLADLPKQQLAAECEKLAPGILSRVQDPVYSDFPYEGTAVYIDRHASIAVEAGVERARLSELTRIVGDLTKSRVKDGFGKPDPYLAVVVADGDRIGAILSRLRTPDEHRVLSRQLSKFAAAARSIVKDLRGVCIYAGGDDVLAFLPLDQCLKCARTLRDRFEELLGPVSGGPPNISVGIAIAHFMEPLEDLRAYARGAELAAKRATSRAPGNEHFGGRNGLAVHVHPRGGVFFGVRERWQEGDSSLERRLDRWAGLFQTRRLPQKLPYDVRELASTYKSWSSKDTLSNALQADCARLLSHKQVWKAEQELLLAQLRAATDAEGLLRFSAELLVAQNLAEPNLESARMEEGTR